MDPNLQNYINQARAAGKKDDQIMQELLRAGWNPVQVSEAFGMPNAGQNVPPPPQQPMSNPFQGAGNNKLMAIISYLGILWIIPFLTDAKNDPFVKFHVKQGIVLFVCDLAVWFLVGYIPGSYMFAPILNLALLAMVIIGVMNAANNQQKPLPVIGVFAEKINF